MKQMIAIFIVLTAMVMLSCGDKDGLRATTDGGPNYDSKETKAVIEKMIAAHGGLDTWRNAKTISFDHILYIPGGIWIVMKEVVDQQSRRTYSDWPLFGAKISFDGKKTWSNGWPPSPPMMPAASAVQSGYFSSNIMWLTQDSGTILNSIGKGRFSGDEEDSEKEYHIIKMRHKDDLVLAYHDLYIDPETYRLRGYETIVTYGGLLDTIGLPPEMKFWGPMYHSYESYITVNGLLFPQKYSSVLVESRESIGFHVFINFSLTEEFDESRMQMNPGDVLDTSSSERQNHETP